MAAQIIGWVKVQKAEGGEEDSKDLSSDSRTVELINEAKSPENIVGDENEKERKEDTDNAVKHDEDDKLRCHDSSGSNSDSNSKSGSGNDSAKSHNSGSRLEGDKDTSKKVHRKNLKKRPLKGKLAKKAREPKVQETLEISPEARLECHSSDSKSNSGDDSSGSKSGSKSDSSTKSSTGSKSDSSTKSSSGSNSGGKKNKGKKKSLELKKEESSNEQNKVADQNKLTEAEKEIEAASGDINGNTATIKEKKKGILGKIMEKLPIYGKNAVEESTEKATKDN